MQNLPITQLFLVSLCGLVDQQEASNEDVEFHLDIVKRLASRVDIQDLAKQLDEGYNTTLEFLESDSFEKPEEIMIKLTSFSPFVIVKAVNIIQDLDPEFAIQLTPLVEVTNPVCEKLLNDPEIGDVIKEELKKANFKW